MGAGNISLILGGLSLLPGWVRMSGLTPPIIFGFLSRFLSSLGQSFPFFFSLSREIEIAAFLQAAARH